MKVECAHCGEMFKPSPSQMRSVRIGLHVCCSHSCAGKCQAVNPGKDPIPCAQCGKEFSHYTRLQKRRQTEGYDVCCSVQCSQDLRRAKYERRLAEAVNKKGAAVATRQEQPNSHVSLYQAVFDGMQFVPGMSKIPWS